jgi:hypothetical protein
MISQREGTMLAPHQHIAIVVERWHTAIHVEYTGRPMELIGAGVVTPRMLEKILSRKGGARCDENGLQFRVCSGSIPQMDAWLAGEPLTVSRIARVGDQALALPGVRELYPNGISLLDADEREAQRVKPRLGRGERCRVVGRGRHRVRWTVSGNLITPDWTAIIKAGVVGASVQS